MRRRTAPTVGAHRHRRRSTPGPRLPSSRGTSHAIILADRAYGVWIGHRDLTSAEYNAFIGSPYADEEVTGADGVHIVIIRDRDVELRPPGSFPVIVCAVGDDFGDVGPAHADLVLSDVDVAPTIELIERSPRAAATLAVLLRSLSSVGTEAGLAMESAAYALLQAGPEFAAWRASNPPADASTKESGPVVKLERSGSHLAITLDRPERHNAITAQLRDELHAALSLAIVDDSISSVQLRGNGPSFCSGGDLVEFGSRPDVAIAHVTRLARSPARLIDHLRSRMSVHLHGAALGGGIEMAAFADVVTAHPSTIVGLPEIGLGLIPGAGGTVSITRRIGRQRTAALALTGRRIDARTALEWGLVDALSTSP